MSGRKPTPTNALRPVYCDICDSRMQHKALVKHFQTIHPTAPKVVSRDTKNKSTSIFSLWVSFIFEILFLPKFN